MPQVDRDGQGARRRAARRPSPAAAPRLARHACRRNRCRSPRRTRRHRLCPQLRPRRAARRHAGGHDRRRDPPMVRRACCMSETSWTERLFGGFAQDIGAPDRKPARGRRDGEARRCHARRGRGRADPVRPRPARRRAHPRASWPKSASGWKSPTRELKEAVAEEIAAILRPVAKPLEITAFPRPQVILVIGVNGSGQDHHHRQARAPVPGG
jgi:hypothetical protein